MSQSLKKTVGLGTLWYSGNTIITKAVSLLTLFFILRSLSVYEYGVVELALSAIAFLSFFRLPGISSVILSDMSRAYGENKLEEARGILSSYFKTQLALALLATSIVFLGAQSISSYYNGQITPLLKIAAFTFLISAFRTTFTTLFSVQMRFFTQSFHTLIEEMAKLVLVLVLLVKFEMGAVGLMYANLFSQFIALALIFPFFWRALRPLLRFSPKHFSIFGLIKNHGKWSFFSGYLNDFSQNARIWIIKIFIGTEAVGIFSVAIGLLNHTASLLPLSQVLTPIIPRHIKDGSRLRTIIGKTIKYQTLAMIFLGLFGFFAFPPVIGFLFPNYKTAMPIYRILIFSLAGGGAAGILTAVFYAMQAQKKYFFSIVWRVVLTAFLSPLFIYFGGLAGAALEYVFNVYIVAIERYFRIKKIEPALGGITKGIFIFDEYDRIVISKLSKLFLS